MAHYAATANGQNCHSAKDVTRPLSHCHLDFWGDRFLNYTPPPQDIRLQRQLELDRLKEEVRKTLLTMATDPKERIIYIDAIERLGVAYHFEKEIEAIVQQLYDKYNNHDGLYEQDLHYISLRFRILRQHGFSVSCDVFKIFKGEDGSFKKFLARDVQGILSLYEASYLKVHGEKILDEAEEFTRTQLKLLTGELSEPLLTEVSQALKLPLHKGMPRLLSRYYLDIYEGNPSHDKTLLRFAKIDFNLLQLLHLQELCDLSRWWKSLNFSTKLPFTRDRIVESYFWAVGTSYQPQYALGRAINTKAWKLLTIMDDIYDAYGLFDELRKYTEAVDRWDKSCMNQLPDYMKLAYENLLDTFDGFRKDLAEEGRSHLVSYLQESTKVQCRGYMREATWLHENYVPTFDEYMENLGIITGGSTFLSTLVFLGMGEIANETAFEWVAQMPKLVKASCVISRLLNDIASRKREQARHHIPTAVDLFMAEYDLPEEKAIGELHKKLDDAWKNINEEMLRPTKIPRPLLTLILNVSRSLEDLYQLGVDGFTVVDQNMVHKIQTLFVDIVTV